MKTQRIKSKAKPGRLPRGFDRKRAGTYAVCVSAASNVLPEFVSPPCGNQEQAEQLRARMVGEHPKKYVRVCYYPTLEQRRRWDREESEAAKFYVTYYQVVYEERVGGKVTCTFPISPPYSTAQKARAALRRSRRTRANALLIRGTGLFNKRRPEDVRARRELLARMQ